MRKTGLCALTLSAVLTFGAVPSAYGADAAAMTDISTHWALDSIVWSVNQGLFMGVSDTAFVPDGATTRAMFVTVLGRMAGVDCSAYQNNYLENLFTDVSADTYYAPYVNWAVRYGIINGTGDGTFSPDDPVTREQIAAILIRFASAYNYALIGSAENVVTFTDTDSVSDYAADAVETLRTTGLINGRLQWDGSYIFDPKGNSTRAECAVLLQRISAAITPYQERTPVSPSSIDVQLDSHELQLGESAYVTASITPQDTTNQTVTWVSMNPAVATVNYAGKVTAVAAGTAEIRGYTWNGLYDSFTVTCAAEEAAVPDSTGASSLASSTESYNDKLLRIFGTTAVSDYRRYYASSAEAGSHMVTIGVPVWQFADSSKTTKVSATLYLTVHQNIADTVKAIFQEIYNGAEQFPIYSAGCYRYEYGSEHMAGLAIDINPNENCEMTNAGKVTTGSFWLPGVNPYSIPANGDVVNAFKKYGFGWGGNWRSKKDYMHFSYFST